MLIIKSLSEKISVNKPVVLTIGKFDGLHIGHLAVLNRAKAVAKQNNKEVAVLTFVNHPWEVLKPDQPVNLLCTLPHKIKLLKDAKVDFLILLPFTKDLSKLTAEEFLNNVQKTLPFDYLILGRHDTTLGKDKEGNSAQIQAVADQSSFQIEFIGDHSPEGQAVSSSHIKKLISQGNLVEAESLLGRKYSIYGLIENDETNELNKRPYLEVLDVSNICLPPPGFYVIQLIQDDQIIKGIAEIQMIKNQKCLLRLYLASYIPNSQLVEVVFFEYVGVTNLFIHV